MGEPSISAATPRASQAGTDRAHFDVWLRQALRDGRLKEAGSWTFRIYGQEIFALLVSLLRSQQDAEEAFSLFCEQLWVGLPGFEGRSSFRTWAYTIAWHAVSRFRTREGARREVLMTCSDLVSLCERVNPEPALEPRDERDRLGELRRTLSAEDRLLLALRIDRELGWNELAQVMHPAPLAREELVRESARLRQRFQAIKARFRAHLRDERAPSCAANLEER